MEKRGVDASSAITVAAPPEATGAFEGMSGGLSSEAMDVAATTGRPPPETIGASAAMPVGLSSEAMDVFAATVSRLSLEAIGAFEVTIGDPQSELIDFSVATGGP
ncbi:hypothetical protein Aple_018920 [Acrocarpospora pleiomorpha]|uniref:Uncharacterized protein n=1 Tax=Acrocarpospora pleiomorpha TaxID=90975 RepID=A0A5M3XBD0_9ACTN|nr:hypothetical protein [Acrocarpospora pleiomorpha]GES18997.1 hypothetical protein Aple_018920 [Acrocarpospora pleiomorpha]